MKKTFLILAGAACFFTQSALAQISLTANPLGQTIDTGTTNLFQVEIRLTITGGNPPNVQGFDLLLETLGANSGFFSITGQTPGAPGTPSSVASYPDALTTGSSNRAGFAQNQFSQGHAFTNAQSNPTNILLTTLSLSINPGTPNGTYEFFSTSNGTSGNRGSSINSSSGTTFFVNNPAQFSITVVPEPATWSMIALGGLAAFGFNRLRAKRRA